MTRPTFDEVYLGMAGVLATRAACSRRQVGALVVKDTFIIAAGYNGVPAGELHCTDGGCPRGKLTREELAPGSPYDTCPAIHAEANALLRAGTEARGATLYTTTEPCFECSKLIKAAGIARVVYSEKLKVDSTDEGR